MKNIFEAPFVREMEKTTANMYRLGWDERNGGNVSYLLDEKEVAEYLDLIHVIRTIRNQSRRRAYRSGRHYGGTFVGV